MPFLSKALCILCNAQPQVVYLTQNWRHDIWLFIVHYSILCKIGIPKVFCRIIGFLHPKEFLTNARFVYLLTQPPKAALRKTNKERRPIEIHFCQNNRASFDISAKNMRIWWVFINSSSQQAKNWPLCWIQFIMIVLLLGQKSQETSSNGSFHDMR